MAANSVPAEPSRSLWLLMAQVHDANLRFPERPVFIPDLVTFQMPDGLGFQFRAAEAPVLVRGRWVEQVMAHLRERMDGVTSLDDLILQAPGDLPSTAVARMLLILHSKGILTAAHDNPPAADDLGRRQWLFWGRHLSITRSATSATEVDRRIAATRLALIGNGLLGSVTADLLLRSGFRSIAIIGWDDDGPMGALAQHPAAGVEVRQVTGTDAALSALRDLAPDIDLLVTATTDAPRSFHRAINDICLTHRTPWVGANSDGSAVDIGPMVFPFETACYECLLLRAASAAPTAIEDELFHEFLEARAATSARPLTGEVLWAASLVASLLVGDVARFASGIAPPTLVDAVLRVLPVTGSLTRNDIERVPRCPGCYRGEVAAASIDPAASEAGGR